MTGSRREATCPLCRAEFGNVESATVERAVLFNLRASKKDLSAEERAEFVTLALTELDKVLLSNERHIPALFVKATVLVEAGRPAEAVDIVARVLVFDEEGQADEAARMAVIDGTEYSTAVSEGRDGDADRLLEQAEAMAVLPPSSRIGGSGPGRLFKVYLQMAKAKEAMGDWAGAIQVYIDHVLSLIDDPSVVGTPPEQRALWMGLSRCFYEKGDYGKAIEAGTAAIEMNRHFPGVHKYVALSQKMAGDLGAARRTAARAALYETPWDKGNRREAAALHRELAVDDTS